MQAPRSKTPATVKYRIVASLALLPLLATCGYKGPLYMPPPPPPPEDSLTTPPQSDVPTPAPAATGDNQADPGTKAQPLPIKGQ